MTSHSFVHNTLSNTSAASTSFLKLTYARSGAATGYDRSARHESWNQLQDTITCHFPPSSKRVCDGDGGGECENGGGH